MNQPTNQNGVGAAPIQQKRRTVTDYGSGMLPMQPPAFGAPQSVDQLGTPNPSRDNAQPFNLTPFTFSVAEKLATAAKERSLSADVMGQALKGKTPMEYFDELENKVIDVTTTNENKTNDIKKLEDDIKNLRPPQADDSAYRAAMDAFNNLATQAPMAPTLERLNVSDTDKIMLGFALLTGANPNDAIGNFIKVKQGFVDQSNEQAMGQYKLDTTNFGNQMDAAGTRLTNERQLLGDNQTSLNQQFKVKMDALLSEADRLQKDGQFQEANQLRVTVQANTELRDFADDVRQYLTTSTGWTAADEKHVDDFVANYVERYGGDANAIKGRLLAPQFGQKTGAQVKRENDQTRLEKLGKLKATKQNYDIAMKSWKQYLSNLNQVGIVDANDIKDMIKVRADYVKRYEFPENMFPLPKEGKTWSRIASEMANDRLVDSGIMTNFMNQYEAALKAFDKETEPIEKVYDESVKRREELSSAFKKANEKYQESQSSSDAAALESARLAYSQYVPIYQSAQQKFESRQGERGRLVETLLSKTPQNNMFNTPFNPTSGNAPPNQDGFVIDKFPAPTKPGGLPDPRVGGGKPNPKDKVEPPTPTPKPQPKPKPTGTSPDAGKGQPEKGGKPVPNKVNIPGTNITKSK